MVTTKQCVLHSMDGSSNVFDINDTYTVHSLIYLLYKLDNKHIYTIYKWGEEHPIFTNTLLNTFEVGPATNTLTLFALKKKITEDILSKFDTLEWSATIEQNNIRSIYHLFCVDTLVIRVNKCYLSTMCYMTNLQHLSLKKCYELSDLTPFQSLYNLHRLTIDTCPKIIDIRPVSKLSNLRRLDIIHCNQLVDTSCRLGVYMPTTFGHVPSTIDSRLRFARRRLERRHTYIRTMNDIGMSVSHMTHLKELYISECGHLTDLTQFATLPNLTTLHITNCENIENTDILRIMTTLTDL